MKPLSIYCAELRIAMTSSGSSLFDRRRQACVVSLALHDFSLLSVESIIWKSVYIAIEIIQKGSHQMKPKEIKDLYPVTPEFHENLSSTLSGLGDPLSARCQKRPRPIRIAVVFAVIAVLAALTSVAYATDWFGLRAERVGKYGLNLRITEDAAKPTDAEKKRVKPIVGYIPEGCELVDGSEESGKYRYTTGGVEYGAEISVGLYITDVSDYDDESRYVVESEDLIINGHQAIIGAQQLEAGGEKSYFGVEYFEDWGYVAHYSGNNKDELLKFMQGVDLEEDVDYTEPPTSAKIIDHMPEDDYAFRTREDYRFVEIGEPFGYTEWSYNEDGKKKPDAFTVTVKSIEERDRFDGLDRKGFMYGERFSEWFDEENRLITPYIRQDYDYGDSEGLNELITHTDTLTERHFMVVTVEATANSNIETDGVPITAWASPIIRRNDGGCDFPTGYGKAFLMYQTAGNKMLMDWKKGDTHTYTFGILVDDEVLRQSCIKFMINRYEIDHKAETVENIQETICVMLKDGAAK